MIFFYSIKWLLLCLVQIIVLSIVLILSGYFLYFLLQDIFKNNSENIKQMFRFINKKSDVINKKEKEKEKESEESELDLYVKDVMKKLEEEQRKKEQESKMMMEKEKLQKTETVEKNKTGESTLGNKQEDAPSKIIYLDRETSLTTPMIEKSDNATVKGTTTSEEVEHS